MIEINEHRLKVNSTKMPRRRMYKVDSSRNENETESDSNDSCDDEDETSKFISSEEEAELEAQRISIQEVIDALKKTRGIITGKSCISDTKRKTLDSHNRSKVEIDSESCDGLSGANATKARGKPTGVKNMAKAAKTMQFLSKYQRCATPSSKASRGEALDARNKLAKQCKSPPHGSESPIRRATSSKVVCKKTDSNDVKPGLITKTTRRASNGSVEVDTLEPDANSGRTQQKAFQCDVCEKVFVKSTRLREHMRLHTGEKPFKCKICGKSFRIKNRLSDHLLRHNKEKAFHCETCGLGVSTKQDFVLHQRHHSKDRRYKCSQCPKAFVRSSDLKIHVRCHTGEKPFACEICNKTFRANQNLIVHRRSHTRENTIKCDYCDKQFIRKIDRKVHHRTHTGEKPYKCEICNRGYSSRVHVRNHLERDHMSNTNRQGKERRKSESKPKLSNSTNRVDFTDILPKDNTTSSSSETGPIRNDDTLMPLDILQNLDKATTEPNIYSTSIIQGIPQLSVKLSMQVKNVSVDYSLKSPNKPHARKKQSMNASS